MQKKWMAVAAAMLVIGWGGNEFTPLLATYRILDGYSEVDVDIFLGAYVLGLAPGLLLASALSDRHGRRPVMIGGLIASACGSAVLACSGFAGFGALFAGRLLSGVGVGVALAVGTSWVSELSAAPYSPGTAAGTGARRAAISLTAGFALGPVSAGVLVQWSSAPLVWPYLVQIALCALSLVGVLRFSSETRFDTSEEPLLHRLRVPAAGHRRFLRVVVPMAPWVFGSGAVAYALVPQLVDARLGHWALLYTVLITVMSLGAGVLVQPIARRLDDVSTARAVVCSLVVMSAGMAVAALTAATESPIVAALAAISLGAGYGIAIVSGLLEVQRIAEPDELAGLTGVYYALTYAGFLLPALLAALAHQLSYPVMLGGLTLIELVCTAVAAGGWAKHLPARDQGTRASHSGVENLAATSAAVSARVSSSSDTRSRP